MSKVMFYHTSLYFVKKITWIPYISMKREIEYEYRSIYCFPWIFFLGTFLGFFILIERYVTCSTQIKVLAAFNFTWSSMYITDHYFLLENILRILQPSCEISEII